MAASDGRRAKLDIGSTHTASVSASLLYACGVFGSVAAELVAALNAAVKNDGHCPALYKRPFYLLVRTAVALLVAGGLPLLLSATNALTAFYIGISAPVLLDRLQRAIQVEAAQLAKQASLDPPAAL